MNNPPAFPRTGFETANCITEPQDGMTLRDYFAAAAMMGMVEHDPNKHLEDLLLAEDAFAVADAMLKARQQ